MTGYACVGYSTQMHGGGRLVSMYSANPSEQENPDRVVRVEQVLVEGEEPDPADTSMLGWDEHESTDVEAGGPYEVTIQNDTAYIEEDEEASVCSECGCPRTQSERIEDPSATHRMTTVVSCDWCGDVLSA